MRDPIIVGGNPRSGTTFTAEMLGEHHDLIMTSELNPGAGELTIALCDQLDAHMGKSAGRERLWEQNRPELVEYVWRSVTGPAAWESKSHAARIGHKTPGAERLFEGYQRAFAPARPHLVYCLRNGVEVLRSLLTMPWRPVPFTVRVEEYVESVRLFETLRSHFPDRVHLIQVDRAPSDMEQRVDWINELLQSLNLPTSPAVDGFVRAWVPHNTAEQVAGRAERDELSGEQMLVLAVHDEFRRIQRTYGYGDNIEVAERLGGFEHLEIKADEWGLPLNRDNLEARRCEDGRSIRLRAQLPGGTRVHLSQGQGPFERPIDGATALVAGREALRFLVYVDQEGELTIQLLVMQYSESERLSVEYLALAPGWNPISVATEPDARTTRLALRLTGHGRATVGPIRVASI